MSGPKKADVVAQLNIAQRSQRLCANLISSAADAAIASILRDAEGIVRDIAAQESTMRDESGSFSSDARRIAPDAVRRAGEAASSSSAAIATSRDILSRAHNEVDRAQQQEQEARGTFDRAEEEYDRAMQAVNSAGGHYMHQEMARAQQATQLFTQAERELAAAAKVRKDAEKSASSALQQAREAKGAVQSARQQIQSTRNEAQSLLKAEADARRIAEEKRRNATLALEKGRSALHRLENLPHQKFCPGKLDALSRELQAAQQALESGRFDTALADGERIASAAVRLEQEVAAAQKEFERRKAEAETQINVLDATLTGMDEALIREWSDTPDACRHAKQVIDQARQAVAVEHFDDATEPARNERQKLTEALRSAAEAKSSHDKRMATGAAIMEVLQELNFDVTHEPGNKTEPMRIAGQTPDEAGKGDFDIAIPLDGEVNFEVNTPQGDISCIGAIGELQKRLEQRGIQWTTTDWGHAEGAAPSGQPRKTTVQEQVQIKQKGKAGK
ncbi:MAG: hypothetical protein J0665_04335 [Deltaproteobacteria bacterium]|nr:hypothetical protein [Deltaproteobacteria bacterium]